MEISNDNSTCSESDTEANPAKSGSYQVFADPLCSSIVLKSEECFGDDDKIAKDLIGRGGKASATGHSTAISQVVVSQKRSASEELCEMQTKLKSSRLDSEVERGKNCGAFPSRSYIPCISAPSEKHPNSTDQNSIVCSMSQNDCDQVIPKCAEEGNGNLEPTFNTAASTQFQVLQNLTLLLSVCVENITSGNKGRGLSSSKYTNASVARTPQATGPAVAMKVTDEKENSFPAPQVAYGLRRLTPGIATNKAGPENLSSRSHIIYVDMDNWNQIFQHLPARLPQNILIWGFAGKDSTWKEPSNDPNYSEAKIRGLVHISEGHISPKHAICLNIGGTDVCVPESIPFTVLSGDNRFLAVEEMFENGQRWMVMISPHVCEIDELLEILICVSRTRSCCNFFQKFFIY